MSQDGSTQPAPLAPEPPLPVTYRRPTRGLLDLGLGEAWRFRRLVYVLIWRDLKVRYKRTLIGAAWAVIQPLTAMVVFTVIFGKLLKTPSDDLPYPVFSYSGLLAWQYFSRSFTGGSRSLSRNYKLISKTAFPRLLIPTSAVLSGLPDFLIAFTVLLGMMAWYGLVPTLAAVTLPLFLLLAILTALGTSLWLASLDVEYRDVRHTLSFLQQIWLFATPVVYPSSVIADESLRALYGLNPMVGVVEGFRWALLGRTPPDPKMLAVSTLAVLLILFGGLLYFRRVERTLADRL